MPSAALAAALALEVVFAKLSSELLAVFGEERVIRGRVAKLLARGLLVAS